MRRLSVRAILSGIFAVSLLSWILAGCGGSGSQPIPPMTQGPVAQTPEAAEEGMPTRNRLVARMPALGQLAPGTEFEYIVSVELAEELYQCSARVGYDPQVVEPVDVEYGELLPSDAVLMSRAGADGIVPFAFTALPGRAGVAPGRGELLRLRFRLTGTPGRTRAVWLINDAEFLQLRDRIGRRLAFDLASEVAQ